jgi:adenylate cyclase
VAPPRYEMGPLFSPALGGLVGFVNAPVGPDGVIRRLDAVLPAERGWLPSLALAVLAAHAGHSPAALADALRENRPLALPVRSPGRPIEETAAVRPGTLGAASWRIDFVGGPGTVTAIPAGPLVALARSGVKGDADNPFRGKIVLVGATFPESRDLYPTPVGLMAGVEIHANIIETLLSRRTLLPPPLGLNLAVLAAACLAVALLSAWLRPLWVAVASAGLIALFAAVSYEAYARGGYWLDFVAPVTGMLAYLQGARMVARRRLRRTFGEFVSPEVVARVARDGATLGGELRTVSVLMSDVRGFTTMAERLPPAEVSETMNEYFTAMVDVILAHRGMVQDFIGDGILAVFGAPLDDADHPMQAVRSALGMQAALDRLNARWKAAGRSPLAIGAAVHTGPVFAGYLGSPRKKKYGVLGDTVNTAARIEGLNRELGTTILVSGAARAVLGDRVTARERGALPLKGKAEPVEVYEVIGLAGETEVTGATARGRSPE